jgi:multidrug efflux system outer membrane protein
MKSFPLAALVATALSGCSLLPTVGPNFQLPSHSLPTSWLSSPPSPTTVAPTGAAWWQGWHDPVLSQLMAQVSGTLSVQQAAQQVAAARAAAGIAAGSFGPSLNATGSAQGSRIGANANPNRTGTITTDTFSTGFDASWELDLFGANRRAYEAATAQLTQQQALATATRLTTQSEVARLYLQARSLQGQLALGQQQAQLAQQLAEITQVQEQAGLTTGLSTTAAQAQAQQFAAAVPTLTNQLQATLFALDALLGAQPGGISQRLLSTSSTLPTPPSLAQLPLPSTLLQQRPDVQAAAAAAHTASANVGVAVADLFPKFSLTGSYGLQAAELSQLDNGQSLVWRGGPSFRWTLFATGQILNNIRRTKAANLASILAYQQTVLNALADVETRLTAVQQAQLSAAASLQAAQAASTQAALSQVQNQQGLIAQPALLQNQLTAAGAASTALQAQAAALTARVALHKALAE